MVANEKIRLHLVKWYSGITLLMVLALLNSGCAESFQSRAKLEVSTGQVQVPTLYHTLIRCHVPGQSTGALTYTWSTTGGTIAGTGPAVSWLTPTDPGSYTITVTATDGEGDAASANLDLDVFVNDPPSISEISLKLCRSTLLAHKQP